MTPLPLKSYLFPYTTLFRSPVLTDVHEYTPMDEVASVVDVLQTPAFLCRQTDFIQKVASAGRPVNIKKDRKSTRLNSSHSQISYAVFCLKKKNEKYVNEMIN